MLNKTIKVITAATTKELEDKLTELYNNSYFKDIQLGDVFRDGADYYNVIATCEYK